MPVPVPPSKKTVNRRFVTEWAAATAGAGFLAPFAPVLWPLLLAVAQWLGRVIN